MFAKLVFLFAIFAIAMARPQLYPSYGYNYPASYPGYASYSGYPGYTNPLTYSGYGGYTGYPSNYGYGYY